jgi:hypothetical protein
MSRNAPRGALKGRAGRAWLRTWLSGGAGDRPRPQVGKSERTEAPWHRASYECCSLASREREPVSRRDYPARAIPA